MALYKAIAPPSFLAKGMGGAGTSVPGTLTTGTCGRRRSARGDAAGQGGALLGDPGAEAVLVDLLEQRDDVLADLPALRRADQAVRVDAEGAAIGHHGGALVHLVATRHVLVAAVDIQIGHVEGLADQRRLGHRDEVVGLQGQHGADDEAVELLAQLGALDLVRDVLAPQHRGDAAAQRQRDRVDLGDLRDGDIGAVEAEQAGILGRGRVHDEVSVSVSVVSGWMYIRWAPFPTAQCAIKNAPWDPGTIQYPFLGVKGRAFRQ